MHNDPCLPTSKMPSPLSPVLTSGEQH